MSGPRAPAEGCGWIFLHGENPAKEGEIPEKTEKEVENGLFPLTNEVESRMVNGGGFVLPA